MTRGLLKPEDAAEYLGVSRATLYNLLRDGEIESVRIGRSRRIPHGALDRYIERLRADQSPGAA